jgi:methylated-DNA-[protein]-cysteine S-methyltransferase
VLTPFVKGLTMAEGFVYSFQFFNLAICSENGAITAALFGPLPSGVTVAENPLIKAAASQITEYLEHNRASFTVPLAYSGTSFQNAVWKNLEKIPYGETRTYKEIALQAGSPAACRAVGQAVHVNPISIFIPCHRVIGWNGKLTGFAGGLDVKQKLLELEQNALFAPFALSNAG